MSDTKCGVNKKAGDQILKQIFRPMSAEFILQVFVEQFVH